MLGVLIDEFIHGTGVASLGASCRAEGLRKMDDSVTGDACADAGGEDSFNGINFLMPDTDRRGELDGEDRASK